MSRKTSNTRISRGTARDPFGDTLCLALSVAALLIFISPVAGEPTPVHIVYDATAPGALNSKAGPTLEFPDEPDWDDESNQSNAFYGSSLGTAGDVNGDGYSDIVVGAYSYDNPEDGEGKIFVYIGGPDGIDELISWTTEIDQAGARFGHSVACAGDVNGDGYDDVIVGAPYYDVPFGRGDEITDAGAAFVYYGGGSGPPPGPIVLEGDQELAHFGFSVATAGDVNGDGYDDVIIGANEYTNGQQEEGRAYIYYGSDSGISTSPAWWAESDEGGSHFGHSVCTAGDVNGDGYSDVVIGARNFTDTESSQGKVFVYHGSAGGVSVTPDWMALGEAGGDEFGYSVSTAGDMDSDGYSDIVIGAPYYDYLTTNNGGRVYVYFGSSSGISGTSHNFTYNGSEAYCGYSVATAGDTNGDGYGDIIIGSPRGAITGGHPGMITVIQGTYTGLDGLFAWHEEFWQDEAWFGACVATAGDANGDGFSEILIGASAYDNGQSSEGAAFAYYGAGDDPVYVPTAIINGSRGVSDGGAREASAPRAVEPILRSHASSPGATGGVGDGDRGVSIIGSASYAGDVNGDGFSDVIIGNSRWSDPEFQEGRAQVYLGSAEGLETTPIWSFESNNEDAGLGESVGTAGDVNGDGYSDIIVGAPYYTNDQTQEGKVFVFYGSPTGPSLTPDWTAEGNQDYCAFGWSVSTAGDYNRDGYSDIIIGAPWYNDTFDYAGRAYLYLGFATGIEPTPEWHVTSGQEWAQLGWSVATAGDVDGDGYSDVLVGIPSFDIDDVTVGAVWAYLGGSSDPDPDPDWEEYGTQDYSGFGFTVAGAGDVDNDGYCDVIISAPFFDTDIMDGVGKISVYLGNESGIEDDPFWWITMDQEYANADECATAGDVNGDGYSDIIFGVPFYDAGQTNEGVAFSYGGSDDGTLWPLWVAERNEEQALLGWDVSSAGDVNGDGFDDILVLADHYDGNQAVAFLHLGNFQDAGHAPNALRPQQQRLSGTPVDLLGSSYSTSIRLNVRGRSPAGRTHVRLEWNIKPLGIAFEEFPYQGTSWLNTGPVVPGQGSAVVLDELITGLEITQSYRWRVRIASRSPFFPHGPWMCMPTSVPSMTQFLTGAASDVPEVEVAPSSRLWIEAVRPNPFTPRTSIVYLLPEPGQVRLDIYDVSGRRVRALLDDHQEAGQHVVSWHGRDDAGHPLAAGTYLARVMWGEEVGSARLVLVK